MEHSVIVTRSDGTVTALNRPAQDLLGPGRGRACWDVVGGLHGAWGLPCSRGCVGRLLARGIDHSSNTPFTIDGERHDLSCVPVDEDTVVCVISGNACAVTSNLGRLTPRECEVLVLIADGLEGEEIGERLGMRAATVRTHVQHMRQKLGVHNRAGLVARGFRLGLLS